MIKATITGLGSVFARTANYMAGVSPAGRTKGALDAAEFAKNAAWVEMLNTPAGQMWSGNVRPSSLPGNYPAVQHADLARSMRAYVAGPGVAHWDAGGGNVPQAFYMEFGTSKLEPRPFMRPTITLYKGELMDRMKRGSIKYVGVV